MLQCSAHAAPQARPALRPCRLRAHAHCFPRFFLLLSLFLGFGDSFSYFLVLCMWCVWHGVECVCDVYMVWGVQVLHGWVDTCVSLFCFFVFPLYFGEGWVCFSEVGPPLGFGGSDLLLLFQSCLFCPVYAACGSAWKVVTSIAL